MNVKKILSSSEDNKLQTSEQKALKAEWFISPDHMKVRNLLALYPRVMFLKLLRTPIDLFLNGAPYIQSFMFL